MIPKPNIFEQTWWLDICAAGDWKNITIDTNVGDVTFTYAIRTRWPGFREIYRPPLTPFLGLSSSQDLGGLSAAEEHKLLCDVVPEIVSQLPRAHRFFMNFHPSFEWWSPFFWEGFKQTTRYTYQLSLREGKEVLWSNLNANARRNIKKAGKTISVTQSNRAGELYDLFAATMAAQGKKPGYEKALLVRLCEVLYEREAGRVLIGEDAAGRPHAGLLLVWHNNEAYYLVGGSDPDLRKSGAMMKVMWEAITMATATAAVFDFEGSMQKGIQQFLRNFNAHPVPYHQLYKSTLRP